MPMISTTHCETYFGVKVVEVVDQRPSRNIIREKRWHLDQKFLIYNLFMSNLSLGDIRSKTI